jgi:hypothetical protein
MVSRSGGIICILLSASAARKHQQEASFLCRRKFYFPNASLDLLIPCANLLEPAMVEVIYRLMAEFHFDNVVSSFVAVSHKKWLNANENKIVIHQICGSMIKPKMPSKNAHNLHSRILDDVSTSSSSSFYYDSDTLMLGFCERICE